MNIKIGLLIYTLIALTLVTVLIIRPPVIKVSATVHLETSQEAVTTQELSITLDPLSITNTEFMTFPTQ